MLSNFINLNNLKKSFKYYKKNYPFDYCVCDDFLKYNFAKKLLSEFPHYDQKDYWHEYNNDIEVKKTCNDWNKFEKNTYIIFTLLNSPNFIEILKKNAKIKNLYSDNGLNGGGLHTHKNGGKLNRHLDYSIHPKINLQRKINFLLYLNVDWKNTYGGELGFWTESSKKKSPDKLIKIIEPKFNRAVFFDTTMNSWHGLVNPVKAPKNKFRQSLAVYYLTDIKNKIDKRSRALFAPDESQKKNKKVLNLIKKRANLSSSKKVYINI
jgi:Rps23 Pro-64 3,4-dihydroxylase Tpa1-like proline 4-hydroxylase